MSWLFTEADWDCWPIPLLDLWCQRARAQPLTISLHELTMYNLEVGWAPELKALLESCSRRWGTLILGFSPEFYSENTIRFLERFLQRACPLLHTIHGQQRYTDSRTTLHLYPDYLPSLQTLCLGGIWPIFSTSSTSVTEFTCTCTCEEDWLPLLDAVKGCHLIQKLTINSSGYHKGFGDDLITLSAITDKAVLSSLTHLEIEGMNIDSAPAISQFLSQCDIPKLERLTVRLVRRSTKPRVFESLCRDVVRH